MLVPSVALLERRSNFTSFRKSANEMIASFLVHIWQKKCLPIALIESFCFVFLVGLQLFGQLHFFVFFVPQVMLVQKKFIDMGKLKSGPNISATMKNKKSL